MDEIETLTAAVTELTIHAKMLESELELINKQIDALQEHTLVLNRSLQAIINSINHITGA